MKVLHVIILTALLFMKRCDAGDDADDLVDDMVVDDVMVDDMVVDDVVVDDVVVDDLVVDDVVVDDLVDDHGIVDVEMPGENGRLDKAAGTSEKRKAPTEWDHRYGKDVVEPLRPTSLPKLQLDADSHPKALGPVNERGNVDQQLRQAIINVHLYMSKVSTNPMQATAAALKISQPTLRKVIKNAAKRNNSPTNVKSKVALPEAPYSTAVPPVKEGGKMDKQFRQTVINVHLYMTDVCTNPIQATAAACHIERHTVSKIISQGIDQQRPRRRRPKKAELDDFDKSVIRRIVHSFYRRKENPTIPKILAEVKKELQDRFPFEASMLRRILHQLGFKYGRQKGKPLEIMERHDITIQRMSYLRKARQYRKENRNFVFLDETWFNCNEGPSRVWQDQTVQQNPNLAKNPGSDLTFGLPAATSRGKRLIVVNAIERSGPVTNALKVFQSKNPVTPEDYHKDMDADNFERWFREQLLPNIKLNSVIVMDNAPYHSRKENSVQLNLKKDELEARLTEIGFFIFLGEKKLPNDPRTMTKKRMVELWKEHRSLFEYREIDRMAEANGHILLRLPPYHCIFINPIEMLWAYQKGRARSQGMVRSVGQALETCEQAFREIPHEDLDRYFNHTIAEEDTYWTRDGVTEEAVPPLIIPAFSSSSESEPDGGETGATDPNV